MTGLKHDSLNIELNAVIVAVTGHPAGGGKATFELHGQDPKVLLDAQLALPSGPFETEHRTLEQGLRSWVKAQSGQPLGYIEQLYTFADRDRTDHKVRTISIGYLALIAATEVSAADDSVQWSPWYRHFPWEDHRHQPPSLIVKHIMPALNAWKNAASDAALKRARSQRIAIAFPQDARQWNEELVLQRYELLWEAGLVDEAAPRARKSADTLGIPMAHDHRRILATAMARLRAKIKYRPVVFELMPETFTLLQLQNAVEALAGLRLHKQNFRRLVETQGLVEETGAMTRGASGRPAKLFAFRREVLRERAASGTKLTRSG
jgi:hypothetical protein